MIIQYNTFVNAKKNGLILCIFAKARRFLLFAARFRLGGTGFSAAGFGSPLYETDGFLYNKSADLCFVL